ncbi:DNA (cytosine-5-)-methyltransferase [Bacillus sp. FJAT-49870]|uniref:Cytosine-specific methyltransferase n=2 Tax=Lederbergia citri TaxID=2833580 RepID=A0A942YH32_9BACI|nr:DNA (cytosine-5-)-methyltransferase [Lederbergia citri]
MSKFTYIELFAGIGGFRQALDKLGGECVFASEIDKFAKQSYTALYGDAHLHGDITKINETDIPDHDLIVAGIPCQAFSVAGKRLGFEDTRGTLFFDVARIAKEKRPKAIWIENVKGLVGHDKGRTLDAIVQTLNDIGYTVDFEVLNSKYFGVPQNRERIFIIAIRDDLVTQEPWIIEGNTIVPKGKRRISAYEGVKTFNFDWPEQTEVATRLRDILETEVDEKYYLDEEKTAKLVAQLDGIAYEKDEVKSQQGFGTTPDEVSYCLTTRYDNGFLPSMFKRRERTAVIEPLMLGHIDLKGHDAIKRVYSAEGVSPTLTTMGGGHREPKIAEQQSYTQECPQCEKLLDFNIFNGVECDCGEFVEYEEIRPVLTPDRMEKRQNGRRFKENDEESFTLTSQDRHGVAIGQAPRYRIRKLSPLECFRLQGFSDEAHETVKAAGISDSQRYKQSGNAVTVNVISAIGKRLLPYLK